ncbi:hypothetical protein ACS0PU_008111 [Formica fusca]
MRATERRDRPQAENPKKPTNRREKESRRDRLIGPLAKLLADLGKRTGRECAETRKGANTNSFPFDIRACEKSVRFIKFRENVGTRTNPPPRHPSIVFLGILINIYEGGKGVWRLYR